MKELLKQWALYQDRVNEQAAEERERNPDYDLFIHYRVYLTFERFMDWLSNK